MYGKEGIVKILLERKDVRTGIPDNENQMLLTLALAQGHDGIAKAILEWDNANSDTADRGGQASLTPLARTGDECAAEMQFPGNDSSPYTLDLNGLSAPPSVDRIRREVVLDSKNSVTMSTDGDFSTKPSGQPQPPSPNPPEPQYPPQNISTQAVFSFATERLFIISLICFFAFFLYILSSSSLDIFSSRKYLSG